MKHLYSEFNEVSKKEWLDKVEKDLKGKAIENLNWLPGEKLTFSPFAHADDVQDTYTPLSNNQSDNDWEIGEEIHVSDFQEANDQSLEALEGGCQALCFVFQKSPSQQDLKLLFQNIKLDWISSYYRLNFSFSPSSIHDFIDTWEALNYNPKKIACSFWFQNYLLEDAHDASVFHTITKENPNAKLFTIDGTSCFAGTENTIEELANILKLGNGLLASMNDNGVQIDQFYPSLQFSIAIGESYFINIAKIRALKLLWNQILKAWNEKINEFPSIISHIAISTQTDDSNYNLIKATTQAMSAVIGGSQSVYLLPGDFPENRRGTTFSRRIVRNIQHLMKMESYLDRVKDPAAGSYYIEQLTDTLAKEAWKQFQELA